MNNKHIEELLDQALKEYEELEEKYYKLQQENKQLKEENKELNKVCELYGQSLYNADLTKMKSILTELEDYLRLGICEPAYIKGDMFWQNACEEFLNKIQELKEKYK